MKKIALISGISLLSLGAVVWCQDNMPTLQLVHSPDCSVVLCGQAQLASGTAVVSLPGWFEGNVKAVPLLRVTDGDDMLLSG